MKPKISFQPADILIPSGIDRTKWSVVACDQYTSQPEYWQEVEDFVGDAPSSYHIIFPEAYLDKGKKENRIQTINQTMQKYLESGLFEQIKDQYLYIERTLPTGKIRRGLIGKIDLMAYDYHPGAQSPVRATEKTVLERIPPRVQIRKDAPLEIPHIMLLIDDPEQTVIEPAAASKTPESCLYQFELMQNGGWIEGYRVPKELQQQIETALAALAQPSRFKQRYHSEGKQPLVYAVGDGNHSLASAKACFEQEKEGLPKSEWENLPSRFALVELVNLHDASLEFEPIHRVVFGRSMDALVAAFCAYYPDAVEDETPGKSICFLQGGKQRSFRIPSQESRLTIAAVQEFLDDYLQKQPAELDYIHGEDVVKRLSQDTTNVGILLPEMKKSDLFQTVLLDGSLPRKTFSMGSANEKRFYLEARKLK